MPESEIEISIHRSLTAIPEADWTACACPETVNGGRPIDPFTTYRFLKALEDSGSVGPGTGWAPRYLVAQMDGSIIAVASLYAKSHSQGEYIFDHNWAQAYDNAGGNYYPKLQIAVPFTPATGRRFLTREGFEETGTAALVQGAVQLASANGLSSLHVTFCTEAEAESGAALGLLPRISQQFHWQNHAYADFDAFLASLSARKRKNIRKERATAQAFGGDIRVLTGDQIEPGHWEAFWEFYQDTGARKWGTPYLTRAFFDIAHHTLRDDLLLVLAYRDGRPIAGALNFIGLATLYGRYWGAVEDHACLHFELCYYQAIDYAIAHHLTRVEAGAQGAHKLARGYLPVPTHSLHWIRDAGFANAVARYLDAETAAVGEEIDILTAYGPFRRCDPDTDPT
ncbi:GNAT family N-acetyltransferase [Pseudoruegeria sp. SK021]|uniref:GNAT family N-acetyltransferase n=1 Tax=Pseudoruegeria sp. SK021 TaxID=1933035 RepID=UPI000A241EAC|nr:GNAT family N-acetyltransferase [Pseudoruegeria sp. SK021]OSP54190.1 GNAT family N-acetyltransferase [Pseudoruegeria sp. SK021]